MESEKKNYCSKYLKVVMAVLLAAALFYSGMKDYVKVGKTDTAVVELYGDYPAVNLAKQIWENYQSSDEITDFWLEKGIDGFRLCVEWRSSGGYESRGFQTDKCTGDRHCGNGCFV